MTLTLIGSEFRRLQRWWNLTWNFVQCVYCRGIKIIYWSISKHKVFFSEVLRLIKSISFKIAPPSAIKKISRHLDWDSSRFELVEKVRLFSSQYQRMSIEIWRKRALYGAQLWPLSNTYYSQWATKRLQKESWTLRFRNNMRDSIWRCLV